MIKVTFRTFYKVKVKRKWVDKTGEIVEYITGTEQDARIRAMALNWTIVKIEGIN